MKRLIFVFAILASVFARGADEVKQDYSDEAMATRLAEQLQPYVETLDRDVVLYHYFLLKRDDNEQIGIHDPGFRERALGMMNRYWVDGLPGNGYNQEGNGLYLAVDPISTNAFGNAMLVVTLHKGTKILKAHGPSAIVSETPVDRYLDGASHNFLWRNFISVRRLAFSKLGVIGYSYAYGTYLNGICPSYYQVPAFLLFGLKDLKSGALTAPNIDVIGLVKRKSRESQEAVDAYSKILAEASVLFQKTPNMIYYYGINPLTGTMRSLLFEKADLLNARQLTPAELAKVQDQTFTCNKLHPGDLAQ